MSSMHPSTSGPKRPQSPFCFFGVTLDDFWFWRLTEPKHMARPMFRLTLLSLLSPAFTRNPSREPRRSKVKPSLLNSLNKVTSKVSTWSDISQTFTGKKWPFDFRLTGESLLFVCNMFLLKKTTFFVSF